MSQVPRPSCVSWGTWLGGYDRHLTTARLFQIDGRGQCGHRGDHLTSSGYCAALSQCLSPLCWLERAAPQKSLKLSPRVSFPPRLAHLDQFKPIFQTWLTTAAGTSIWMAEPPLSASTSPVNRTGPTYFKQTLWISWIEQSVPPQWGGWINAWWNKKPRHKYQNVADLTKVIDYQMAAKHRGRQQTLISSNERFEAQNA